jgi:hypothetical protein
VTRSLALIVAVVVALAGAAIAKPKIALTPIDGDDNDEMADAVESAIDGVELDVTGTRSTSRALDKLDYDTDLSEKQAKKVSEALDVDAILIGTLDRKGVNKVLRFRMFIRGKKTRGFSVTFNNPRSDRFKVMLREKLVDKIDNAKAEKSGKKAKARDRDEDEEDTADEDEDRKSKKAKKGKKSKKRRSRDEDEDEDDEGGEDDLDEEELAAIRAREAHSPNRVAVRVDMGISFQNRNLSFTSRKNNYPQAPNPYTNGMVPGARLEAEIYPLAFSNPRSIAGGLGLAASFDRTLSLTLSTSEEPGVPIKTTQQQWSVGARMRIPFGQKVTSPSMTLLVDYGSRSFEADRSGLEDPANLDLPDTAYTFAAGGLNFRFPLAKAVAFVLGGRAVGVLDAGAIQQPDQYGQAKVFGVQAGGGLDIVFAKKFAVRLVGEFSQFGFAFVGNGAMTNSRDNDPETKDIGGAADRSIGGAATFGVLY